MADALLPGVLVGAGRVAVGMAGTEVGVRATVVAVLVGVAVGGSVIRVGVAVGGTGVRVGVAVGGTGVRVGVAVAAGGGVLFALTKPSLTPPKSVVQYQPYGLAASK